MNWDIIALKTALLLKGIRETWLLASAVSCLLVSVVLGSYRSYCIHMQGMAPWNVPNLWHTRWFSVLSWFVVTLGSLWFALAASILVSARAPEPAGAAAFGTLLVLRWLASRRLGKARGAGELKRFESFGLEEETRMLLPEDDEAPRGPEAHEDAPPHDEARAPDDVPG